MAKKTDLYPLLCAYSAKNKTAHIDIPVFLDYLEKYAQRKVQEQPEWKKWLTNIGVQFWTELSALVENDNCLLIENDTGGQVYLPGYFIEMLKETYSNPDKIADKPFPSEESLGISIPANQLKTYNLKNDMGSFIKLSDDSDNDTGPDTINNEGIIKVVFPEDCDSVLLLLPMIPRKFLELAILKIRHYLNTRSNKEYILNKLIPQFQGKDKYLRDILEQAIVRPMECLNSLEKSGDFTYIFWNSFSNLVKNDIKKRKETTSEDIAAIQAVYIMEVFNGLYRTRAIKIREKEIAFRNLELCMTKPPFYFTKEEIIKFRTDKGLALIEMYSPQDLDDYIKKATTESKNNGLPEWFVVDGKNNMQWYLKKEKYLSICITMLVSSRPLVKKEITRRWAKMLREFDTEPAMEKDGEFEKLLGFYSNNFNPVLSVMLEDKKLLWVCEEMERTQGIISSSLRIFKMGKLLPMSVLYSIRRKDLLTDARIILPFWYSFPVISAIAAFFYKLKKKKKKKQAAEYIEIEVAPDLKTKTIRDLKEIAELIKTGLVPLDQTMDSYMALLENKWNKLIDANSRLNLLTDIQSLVRDNLRKMVKIHKTKKISFESISEAANQIIMGTPSLHSLSNQESLGLYIKLYMAKLLSNVK